MPVTLWPHRSRAWNLLLVIVGVCAIVLALLEGLRLAQLYRELSDGRIQLLTAAALLQQQASPAIAPATLTDAQARLVRARTDLQRAGSTLNHDPELALARRLPYAGAQLAAARDLDAIGLDLSDIGLESVAALQQFQQTRAQQGGSVSEQIVPALGAAAPQVNRIEQDYARAQATRAGVEPAGLLPPLQQAFAQLDRRMGLLRNLLDDYRLARANMPAILGYNGPQTYLVLAHDNSEILGGNGFVLMYGFLTFDHGRLVQHSFDNVANIDRHWPPPSNAGYIAPPAPLRTYLLRGWPMSLAEASWWPDFPTEARQAITIYHTNSHTDTPIDGVIGVNFLTLAALMQVTGSVALPAYHTSVSSSDVIEKVLIMTNPPVVNGNDPHRYDFASTLVNMVVDRTLSLGVAKWQALFAALQQAARTRELYLYATAPGVEQAAQRFAIAGAMDHARGDFLMPVDSSVGTTKLNLVVRPSMSVDVHLLPQGSATVAVTLTYTNAYAAWAKEQDPRLLSVLGGPAYVDYLRLYAPAGSSLEAVTQDGQIVRAEPVASDGGRTVFARYFRLPLNATTRIRFSYTVPAASLACAAPFEYCLTIEHQPGIAATPLALQVAPPAGDAVVSISLDGRAMPVNGGRVATDLSQDRQIVVHYQPQG